MFPIVSLLRKVASFTVYVDSPDISLDRKVPIIAYSDGKFSWRDQEVVQMHQMTSSKSPQLAAKEISQLENKLYNDLRLGIHIYTVFFGPEEVVDGKRISRVGVARGVHRR